MELKIKTFYYKNGLKKIKTHTHNGTIPRERQRHRERERERERKLERSLEQTPEEDKTRERER
jgi:hypothetical protein